MLNSISGVSSTEVAKFVDIFTKNKQKSTAEAEANINQYINNTYNSADKDKKSNLQSDKNVKNVGLKDDSQSNKDEKVDNYKELADKLKEMAGAHGVYFEFVLEKDTKEMLMRVIDEETKEVLRQYPSEVALKIAKIVNESLGQGQGQFTNVKI